MIPAIMKQTTYVYRQGKDTVTIVFKDDKVQSKDSTLLRLIRCERAVLSAQTRRQDCPLTSSHHSAEDSGLYSTKRDLPRITALG